MKLSSSSPCQIYKEGFSRKMSATINIPVDTFSVKAREYHLEVI